MRTFSALRKAEVDQRREDRRLQKVWRIKLEKAAPKMYEALSRIQILAEKSDSPHWALGSIQEIARYSIERINHEDHA